ncbi:MAG: caspase family protein [Limnospira maxima]|uniref:Peptidase C14 caspase catalytic subunit p20 n=2 Tax=Limnospira TaxID=2596745 RepID=A0A9P1KDF4_9CYAN|nr:caspase family protein [Limnospira indica]CDM93665.1 Peptidase C14 caspase catalytic subunit p20 [Limnospira indica PCC 8005]
MSNSTRRHFLQFLGAALATLGIDPVLFHRKTQRHRQVLAQSTSRKLALLVGINSYSTQPLIGCVNDIYLQRELLIHRFGFHPQDIYILEDKQATRDGILTAFEEYLIKQAKPGDVVVYHYSGHGSRIFDPQPILREVGSTQQLNGTFVPVDGDLPPGYPNAPGSVKDIMGHTLFLLMSALQTENVTVVLDSCFAGGATREARVRSRDGGQNVLVSDYERSYQQQWLSRLNMSPEEFVNGYRTGVAKGVVLSATAPHQLAREVNVNGFDCGLFSYLLTHYMWNSDSNIQQLFTKIIPEIPKNFYQQPRYEVKVGSGYQLQTPYFINNPNPPAQAVVTQVSGSNAQLWLGGINLRNVSSGTILTGVNSTGKVRIIDRNGILAQAEIEEPVTVGTLLHQGG